MDYAWVLIMTNWIFVINGQNKWNTQISIASIRIFFHWSGENISGSLICSDPLLTSYPKLYQDSHMPSWFTLKFSFSVWYDDFNFNLIEILILRKQQISFELNYEKSPNYYLIFQKYFHFRCLQSRLMLVTWW